MTNVSSFSLMIAEMLALFTITVIHLKHHWYLLFHFVFPILNTSNFLYTNTKSWACSQIKPLFSSFSCFINSKFCSPLLSSSLFYFFFFLTPAMFLLILRVQIAQNLTIYRFKTAYFPKCSSTCYLIIV